MSSPTTIHKFKLEFKDSQEVEVPSGSELLSCQMKDGNLYIWALVDPSQPDEVMIFDIFGTGFPYHCSAGRHVFVSTVQDDPFVWHVFKRENAHY